MGAALVWFWVSAETPSSGETGVAYVSAARSQVPALLRPEAIIPWQHSPAVAAAPGTLRNDTCGSEGEHPLWLPQFSTPRMESKVSGDCETVGHMPGASHDCYRGRHPHLCGVSMFSWLSSVVAGRVEMPLQFSAQIHSLTCQGFDPLLDHGGCKLRGLRQAAGVLSRWGAAPDHGLLLDIFCFIVEGVVPGRQPAWRDRRHVSDNTRNRTAILLVNAFRRPSRQGFRPATGNAWVAVSYFCLQFSLRSLWIHDYSSLPSC